MNNVRRKEIGKMVIELEELAVRLEEAYDLVLQLNEEEEEYRENMPENLQGGERYMISEEASDHLEDAGSTLGELVSSINEVIGCLEDAMV